MLQKVEKKLFKSGVVIPVKMRLCNECNDIIICDMCDNQVNENEEFATYLFLLRTHPPNQFG